MSFHLVLYFALSKRVDICGSDQSNLVASTSSGPIPPFNVGDHVAHPPMSGAEPLIPKLRLPTPQIPALKVASALISSFGRSSNGLTSKLPPPPNPSSPQTPTPFFVMQSCPPPPITAYADPPIQNCPQSDHAPSSVLPTDHNRERQNEPEMCPHPQFRPHIRYQSRKPDS